MKPDWQPIVTAPKGVPLLLWSPDFRYPIVSYWLGVASHWNSPPTHWAPPPEPPDG